MTLLIASFGLFLASFLGCKKEDESVATYLAPKEPKVVVWAVPSGWVALKPSQLEYAAYQATAVNEPVRVSVSYLHADAPSATNIKANVDRWRQQLQLPPATDQELMNLVVLDKGTDMVVQKVDLIGNDGTRIIAAIVPREDRIWFYKMRGDSEDVIALKNTFDQFVISSKYLAAGRTELSMPMVGLVDSTASVTSVKKEPTSGEAKPGDSGNNNAKLPSSNTNAPAATPGETAGGMKYMLPKGWTVAPSTIAMRVMTLSTGTEKPAQVIVSTLSGNFGGMAMNLARWRGEVGAGGDSGNVVETPIKIGAHDGLLIDLQGPGKDGKMPSRSMIARCTVGESVWFFKLIGPEETVSSQKAAFDELLKSIRLPGE